MISLNRFGKSLAHAGHGLREVYASEHSFRVQVLVAVLLLLVILALGITGVEAALLVLVASMVLVLELANSIFERWLDIASPRVGAQVRDAKDIMAAAVLVASVTALIVGAVVITPHLLR